MDSLYVEKQADGGWAATAAGTNTRGTGDTELEAVKSLARALRNRLEAIEAALTAAS